MFAGLAEVTPSIDPNRYEVLGSDMQILNLKLSGQEAISSVPGAMAYMVRHDHPSRLHASR